jgi:hypothetical protein
VLSALAAQAWWEGRQERLRERDYLTLGDEARSLRRILEAEHALRDGAARGAR